MDIQNILEQAKQRGLSALDSIRRTVTPTQTPQNIGTTVGQAGIRATQPLTTYRSELPKPTIRPLTSLATTPQMSRVSTSITPITKTPEIKSIKAFDTAFQPIKSVVSLSFLSKPDVLKPTDVNLKPATTQKTFELPRPSEMIFGDWAKQANKYVSNLPTQITQNEDKALEGFRSDLQTKLDNEIRIGQGDSIQAQRFKTDIENISKTLETNNFFTKNQLRRDLGQQYATGGLIAGNIQTGKNLWSTAVSVYDQYTKSDEEKKKIQDSNVVVQDGVTKFLDNVLADLRPANQNLVTGFIESVGGMAGLIYASSLVKTPYLATVIGTGLESIAEGGATYDENRKKGMSIEEAFNRESSVIASNVILNYLTNRFTGIFEAVPEKELKSIYKKITNTLAVSGAEGFQEFGQNGISNLATDRPFLEGAVESFGFGVVIGGGLNVVKLRNNKTGETVAEIPVKPSVAKQIVDESANLINTVSGQNISVNSSAQDITNAYNLSIANALTQPNSNQIINQLNGAYQTLNSVSKSMQKVAQRDVVDPEGILSNEEYAKKKTEIGVRQKEEARGKLGFFKDKYETIKTNYENWVNNVETPGKILKDIDKVTAEKLGRPLKPSESIDVYYDEQYQVENIVAESDEMKGMQGLFKKLIQTKLNLDEFGQYLESRRNLALAQAGAKKDVDIASESRTVAGFENKYGQLANEYYRIMDGLSKKVWESGLISTETYLQITQNKDYTPFYKVFSEDNKPTITQLLQSKFVGRGKQTVVRTIESSKTNIVENPALMTVPYIYSAYRQMQQNDTGKALINAVREGYVQDAGYTGYIVQSAEDSKMRKFVRDSLPQVNNLIDKLTKRLRKQKKSLRGLQKEVEGILQDGYKIISLNANTEIDNKYVDRLTRRIETKLDKRDELVDQAQEILGNIIKVKQEGQEVLSDTKYINRTNRMIETRKEWVQDLVDIGADLLGKKGKKLVDRTEKVPSLKERRNFIKTASTSEILDYIHDLYNLPYGDFKKLLQKATTKNLKIKGILQEIDAIKNAQITNQVVNGLIKADPKQLETWTNKLANNNKAFAKVLKDLKYLTDARIAATAVNSLIKNEPSQLEKIKKQLNKKYPIVDQMIQDVLDTQNSLDNETGYAQRLKEIESELNTVESSTNLETVEALVDGFVEKAVIDKRLADSLKVTNNPEFITNTMRLINWFTSIVKVSRVVIDPAALPRLFAYDQQFTALMSKAPFKTSILNVPAFAQSLFTTLTSGTYSRYLYNVLPEQIQGGIKAWDEWQSYGGASSEGFLGSKENAEKWARSGGRNKVSYKDVFNFLGKTDLIARFQIYNVNKQIYLAQGYSEQDAGRQAAYDSRNLLPNFYRRSNTLRFIDTLLPFFAASVQASGRLRQALKENPQQTIDRLMIPAMIYALSMLWNLSTEERRKAWNGIQQWKKDSKLIVFLDQLDENGNPFYTEIPVDQSLMNTLQGVRKTIEGFASASPDVLLTGVSNLFEGLYGVKIPVGDNYGKTIANLTPALRLLFELPANYSYFENREIVPQRLQNKKPYLQYDEKTAEYAKSMGASFNLSPMKIEYAVKSLFGNIPGYVENLFEKNKNGTATPAEQAQLKQVEQTVQGLWISNKYGAEEQKIWEAKTQADLDRDEVNTKITEKLNAGDFKGAKELASGQVTKEQWKGLENSYQEQQIENTLTGKEKAYFNMPKTYLETVKETTPEDAEIIDKVLELKKSATNLPNMDTADIKFKPSSKSGGGGSVKVGKPTTVKLGKIKKPRGIRVPKAPAPKKLKVKKAQRVKQPKLAKVKPLKKVSRF
jgi:hypothetical protein